MHFDHFFTIGAPHASQGRPCEDYACSSGSLVGALSDGCGGANANTDIGSRTLVHAFMNSVQQGAWPTDPGFGASLANAFWSSRITQDPMDYLATLVGLAHTPERTCLYLSGDGGYALRYKSGFTAIRWITWDENRPFYLAYLHSRNSIDAYQSLAADPVTFHGATLQDDALVRQWAVTRPLSEWMLGVAYPIPQTTMEQLDCILLFSDGIEQIGQQSVIESVQALLRVKNRTGSFLKRRALRMLSDIAKRNERLGDDLSTIALIREN